MCLNLPCLWITRPYLYISSVPLFCSFAPSVPDRSSDWWHLLWVHPVRAHPGTICKPDFFHSSLGIHSFELSVGLCPGAGRRYNVDLVNFMVFRCCRRRPRLDGASVGSKRERDVCGKCCFAWKEDNRCREKPTRRVTVTFLLGLRRLETAGANFVVQPAAVRRLVDVCGTSWKGQGIWGKESSVGFGHGKGGKKSGKKGKGKTPPLLRRRWGRVGRKRPSWDTGSDRAGGKEIAGSACASGTGRNCENKNGSRTWSSRI